MSNKKIIIAIISSILAGAGWWYFYYYSTIASTTLSIKIGSAKLNVDLAITPAEMSKGLSGRESLTENEGMLFIFPAETIPAFWMKDMKFAIDIIWIDKQGRVVGIEHNLQPDSYPKLFSPSQPVKYVLEVKAGWAKRHLIKLGDRADVPKSIYQY